ncbi:cobalamin biosynthesis protein [Candidatus Bathyarchaeota archaeon RBG_13_38_9]|nr:MAG: cobalamin biosynthesis protein [Candidatus Bathyarchaeota archaeon RBG_13_38_9]
MFLAIIVLVSPIFGIILADIVGFHEPLDIAAERLELQDLSKNMNWTPLFKYNIPGISPEIGYIISGLLGIAIILGAGLIFKGFVKQH